MNDDDPLTDEERTALSELRRNLAPPMELEPRVVADLRQRGLLGQARAIRAGHWPAVVALGMGAALAIGVGIS
jgi:hypothetical protein